MEKLFMSAGIVTAIVLCIVGIVKLPFKGFKEKHCNWYKAMFTILSLVLAIGLSILNQQFILKGNILSVNFIILLSSVLAGVFCGYGGIYEGLGVKELVKNIVNNIKQAREIAEDEKVKEYLDKVNKIDEAIEYLEKRKKDNNTEV